MVTVADVEDIFRAVSQRKNVLALQVVDTDGTVYMRVLIVSEEGFNPVNGLPLIHHSLRGFVSRIGTVRTDSLLTKKREILHSSSYVSALGDEL